MLELEEARARQKDPSSRTRKICGGLCILGSDDRQTTPIVACVLFAIAVMITLMLTFIVYENLQRWQTLGYVTSAFSMLTLLLMFVVMCSDPGIQSRDNVVKIPSQVSDVENRHPENVVGTSYRQNTQQDSDELPDLRELGFNRHEEQMIKQGFSRVTHNVDMMNSTGSS